MAMALMALAVGVWLARPGRDDLSTVTQPTVTPSQPAPSATQTPTVTPSNTVEARSPVPPLSVTPPAPTSPLPTPESGPAQTPAARLDAGGGPAGGYCNSDDFAGRDTQGHRNAGAIPHAPGGRDIRCAESHHHAAGPNRGAACYPNAATRGDIQASRNTAAFGHAPAGRVPPAH